MPEYIEFVLRPGFVRLFFCLFFEHHGLLVLKKITSAINHHNDKCNLQNTVAAVSLLPRVLRLLGQRVVTGRDSGW